MSGAGADDIRAWRLRGRGAEDRHLRQGRTRREGVRASYNNRGHGLVWKNKDNGRRVREGGGDPYDTARHRYTFRYDRAEAGGEWREEHAGDWGELALFPRRGDYRARPHRRRGDQGPAHNVHLVRQGRKARLLGCDKPPRL